MNLSVSGIRVPKRKQENTDQQTGKGHNNIYYFYLFILADTVKILDGTLHNEYNLRVNFK